MTDPAAGTPLRAEGVIPILRVRNLKASIAWYAGVLGFREDWHVPGVMASVSHDRLPILLCEGAQGVSGTWVWIGVDDPRRWYEQARAAGAKIVLPPTNFSWALECQVEDPDGHVLRLGSVPLAGEPLGTWPTSMP